MFRGLGVMSLEHECTRLCFVCDPGAEIIVSRVKTLHR